MSKVGNKIIYKYIDLDGVYASVREFQETMDYEIDQIVKQYPEIMHPTINEQIDIECSVCVRFTRKPTKEEQEEENKKAQAKLKREHAQYLKLKEKFEGSGCKD